VISCLEAERMALEMMSADARHEPRTRQNRAEAELDAPSTLGPYRLGARIGSGCIGVVYVAKDSRDGTSYAVKVARREGAEFKETMDREVNLLSRFRHPGIVRLHDHGQTESVPWYAMELLSGASLRAVMESNWTDAVAPGSTRRRRGWSDVQPVIRPECLARALRVVQDLCAPLGYLHGQGFVHADVKPENVFLCDDGRVVLLDLGAAQPLEEIEIEGGASYGTWPYMAPECRVGARGDHRIDVYALGCILHEFVVGCTPAEQGLGRRSAEVPRCALPPELSGLIRRFTALDPCGRPSDLYTCAAELGETIALI
jgi:serine/threonine protein kinase